MHNRPCVYYGSELILYMMLFTLLAIVATVANSAGWRAEHKAEYKAHNYECLQRASKRISREEYDDYKKEMTHHKALYKQKMNKKLFSGAKKCKRLSAKDAMREILNEYIV